MIRPRRSVMAQQLLSKTEWHARPIAIRAGRPLVTRHQWTVSGICKVPVVGPVREQPHVVLRPTERLSRGRSSARRGAAPSAATPRAHFTFRSYAPLSGLFRLIKDHLRERGIPAGGVAPPLNTPWYSRSSRLAIRAPRSAIWSSFSVNRPLDADSRSSCWHCDEDGLLPNELVEKREHVGFPCRNAVEWEVVSLFRRLAYGWINLQAIRLSQPCQFGGQCLA